jgi:hypothetical protein
MMTIVFFFGLQGTIVAKAAAPPSFTIADKLNTPTYDPQPPPRTSHTQHPQHLAKANFHPTKGLLPRAADAATGLLFLLRTAS